MTHKYVHGYHKRELERLVNQSRTLGELLHSGTRYTKGAKVLEAGCGVGAQTAILAANSPLAGFTSIDISEKSLHKASARINKLGIKNVEFRPANIYKLPFKSNSFHHIFVCFVLEHLEKPLPALKELKRVLKKGGTITVIEGDHGSCFFHPDSFDARHAWECLVKAQAKLGGDSLIGRRLYPFMQEAGFKKVKVEPKTVYADASRPAWVKGFTMKTIIAMVKGAKAQALKFKLTDKKRWNKGIKALWKTAGRDGTFTYLFFKGTAVK